MGCLQFGIGFWCFTVATRYIMASEVALFSLTESLLGPIWVWLLIRETPALATLIGGIIIIASVTGFAVLAILEENRRRQPVRPQPVQPRAPNARQQSR